MRPFILVALGLMSLLPSVNSLAADLSPVGLWATVSDESGEVRSIVRITLDNGELIGKIEKLVREPGEEPNPICRACPGNKKNQTIQGMTILWGLRKNGNDWTGGSILDPGNGKTYRSKLNVMDDNRTLEVRGFIGISLLGRTQTWIRRDSRHETEAR